MCSYSWTILLVLLLRSSLLISVGCLSMFRKFIVGVMHVLLPRPAAWAWSERSDLGESRDEYITSAGRWEIHMQDIRSKIWLVWKCNISFIFIIPCSKEPTSLPYPKENKSSRNPSVLFTLISNFMFFLPSNINLQSVLFSTDFQTKTLNACPTPLIFFTWSV